MISRVAAIHDISGFGRCSLTAAIPILSAMGVQPCPLPTAVLSNQTGFESFESVDLTSSLDCFSKKWEALGIVFSGIYTGFLCNPEQATFAEGFIRRFGGTRALTLVDPVLGDHGAFYPVFDDAMRRAVKRLVRCADVITPNLTEACLLADADPTALIRAPELAAIWEMARELARLGPHTVVITGVPDGERILNLCWLAQEQTGFCVETKRLGHSFSGTGDVLASVLCGGLVRGDGPRPALELAARLLERAITHTLGEGEDPNHGVAFEPYLSLLLPGGALV